MTSSTKPKPTTLVIAVILTAVIVSGLWYAAAPSIMPPSGQEKVIVKTVTVGGEAPKQKVMKIAFIVSSAAQDRSWNQWGYDGITALDKQRDDIEVTVSENVAVADFERVAGDFARRGYELIVAHTNDYQEPALATCKANPQVKILVFGAWKFAPNCGGYAVWAHEGAYLAGYMQAAMSKTGKVAFLAAYKYASQVVWRNGYLAGIKAANADFKKDVKMLEAWTGTWFDVAKGAEAANAMFDAGADQVLISLSGPGIGALEAAKKRNILGVGAFVDMSYLGDNIVTSITMSLWGPVTAAVDQMRAGRFEGRQYNFGIAEKAVDLSPISDKVPKDIRDKVLSLKQQIAAGSPIVPYVPAGELPQ